MATPEVKLTCGQCGYANEPERVYCHNCGSKLDRSVLPKEEGKKRDESPETARKRISKMTNPSSTSVGRELFTFVKVVASAAACAALLLTALKPDGVPETKSDLLPRMISMELADTLAIPAPRSITFTEADVNAHLLKTVKAKEGTVPGVEFKRMFVNFLGGDLLRVGTEQSLWGYPVYSGMQFKLSVAGGKLGAECVGGNFGRLSVHPAIMKYADFAFQKLWTALKRDRDQMDRMQSVKVEKGSIQLVTKGTPR